jgi:hypothetical protein
MGRFLDTKAAQFAKCCVVPKTSEQLFDNVHERWSYNPNRTLEESLVVMETFDIISNFMLLHILGEPDTVAAWLVNLDQMGFPEEAQNFRPDPHGSILLNWKYILNYLQPYLTPFDILSLFSTKDEISKDTQLYLATLLEPSTSEPPGMGNIECDLSRKLKDEFQVDSHRWESHRRHAWSSELRGRLFCEDVSVAEIANSIVQTRDHKCAWWQFLVPGGEGADFQIPVQRLYLTDDQTRSENIEDDDCIELYTISAEGLCQKPNQVA